VCAGYGHAGCHYDYSRKFVENSGFGEIHPKIHPWGEGILDHESREMKRKRYEIIPGIFIVMWGERRKIKNPEYGIETKGGSATRPYLMKKTLSWREGRQG
jgi:hypothetical protein